MGDDILSFDISQYATFNLKEVEVTKLQGGTPTHGASEFSKPLSCLKEAAIYPWWDRYFGPANNKAALDPHRLVILDSGGDSGLPASAKPDDLPGILLNYLDGDLPRDTVELTTGCPNTIGYD